MEDGRSNIPYLSDAETNSDVIYVDEISETCESTADFVLCKSQAYGSHSIMEKAQSLIRERKDGKTHFIYLSKITNIEQSEREIYDAIISCLSGGMSNAG